MSADQRVCPQCGRKYPGSTKFCTQDGTPLAEVPGAADPLAGEVLMDRWKVVDRLGSGGFATVYEVRDLPTGTALALKAFDRRRVSPNDLEEAVARFRREARLLRELGHLTPHILTVEELVDDEENEVMYLPMELLTGESLADIVEREGTLPPGRIIPIVRQICEALRVAHGFEDGVVHRDLSLGNVMISEAEEGGDLVKILDFGIAKALGDEGLTNLTIGGPGTPAYAAPEQVEGRDVDGRTDLFTLGVVIYAMMTGREPWLGGSITDMGEGGWKMLRATVDADPKPVHEWNPDADPGLVALALKLLQKRPEDRFQSAVEVLEALEKVARGESLEAGGNRRDRLRIVHARAGLPVRIRKGRFFPRTVAEGETPWELDDLSPGTYRVEVTDPRFEKEVRTIRVVEGEDQEVVLTATRR